MAATLLHTASVVVPGTDASAPPGSHAVRAIAGMSVLVADRGLSLSLSNF